MKNVVLLLSLALLGCPAPPEEMTPDLNTACVPFDLGTTSCCGQPCDKGNNAGVGKFCKDIADCSGNMRAQLCSSLGNTASRKAFFCTFLCDPKTDAGNPCGDNASCECDTGGVNCGCTPKACTMNTNPGC